MGTSCKNKAWDPEPTNADALARLKIVAAQKGANAIDDPTYVTAGTSLSMNCWKAISASANAYQLAGPQ